MTLEARVELEEGVHSQESIATNKDHDEQKAKDLLVALVSF